MLTIDKTCPVCGGVAMGGTSPQRVCESCARKEKERSELIEKRIDNPNVSKTPDIRVLVHLIRAALSHIHMGHAAGVATAEGILRGILQALDESNERRESTGPSTTAKPGSPA